MSLPIFTMTINGGTEVRCSDVGWSVESLTRRNQQPDAVTLVRALRSDRTTAMILKDDKLQFYMDGQPWFYGTAQSPAFRLGENASTVSLQILGPWFDLQKLTFVRTPPRLISGSYVYLPHEEGDTFVTTFGDGVQVWDSGTETWVTPTVGTHFVWGREDDFTGAGTAPDPWVLDIARYTSSRGLICDPDWDHPPYYRTAQAEIESLVSYALDVYAMLGLTAPFSADLVTLTDDLGATASPRYRTFQDRKVSELLAEALACKPDAATWWDYRAGVPVLKMAVATEAAETTLTPGSGPLRSLDAQPMSGALPAGVVIKWEYTDPFVWQYRGWKLTALFDKYPATVLMHDPGVMCVTVDYDGPAAFRPEMAESLYNSLSTLRATGSLVLGGLSATEASEIRPGLTYRLAGDDQLAQAQLLVQETTWNIRANTVTCSLGYPKTLDLQQLMDLRGWAVVTLSGWTGAASYIVPTPP